MLLSIAADKNGKLIACDVVDPEGLIWYLKLKVSARKLQALRKKLDSDTEVCERLVEEAYPNNPALVEYDESATCIRVRVFTATKVLMGIEGGLVQWIQSNVPVETLRLDQDIDEDDDDNIEWTDIDGNKSKVAASHEQATVNPAFVEKVYREVLSLIA